jgi:hypothetical protein
MNRRDAGLEPELEAFLEPKTIDRRVPADVRARALASARAILAAGGAIARRPLAELPPPLPVPVVRGRRVLRIAVAASLAFVAGTVAAVAALRGRADPALSAPKALPVPPAERTARAPEPPREIAAAEPGVRLRSARARTNVDTVTVELELVQRAHAAFTRHDFIRALMLTAEHARRFPNGHLAEQREALRVRSLASAGRADEAHRAAAAFATRFPRSVLLPRLEGGSQAPD